MTSDRRQLRSPDKKYRHYELCPKCGRKGYYFQRAPIGAWLDVDDVPDTGQMVCRYCGHRGG